MILMVGRNWSQDTSQLEEYVQKNPKDLDSVYKLANTLSSNDKHKEALKYWRHLAKSSNSTKTLYFYSVGLYRANLVTEALKICDRIDDDSFASKCTQMKSKAAEEFSEQHKLYLAEKALADNKLDEASEMVTELISDDEQNPDYRVLLGKIYHKRKKYDFAMDQYLFADSESDAEKSEKWRSKLAEKGAEALDYVLENRSAISDQDRFYLMVYIAFKLEAKDVESRIKGFIIRAIEYYKEKVQEEETFDLHYRLGYLHSLDKSIDEAKTNYQKALDNAQESMYPIIEFLIANLDKQKDQETYVIDLISQVGGEEAYKELQKAAMAEDQENAKNIADATMNDMGVDKAQFVAEWNNVQKRINNSSSKSDKDRIYAEFKQKYGHMVNDPSKKKALQKFMKSGEGQKLKEKYASQIKKFQ